MLEGLGNTSLRRFPANLYSRLACEGGALGVHAVLRNTLKSAPKTSMKDTVEIWHSSPCLLDKS